MEPTQNNALGRPIRVAIFDDDEEVRDGFSSLFRLIEDFDFVGAEADVNHIEAFVAAQKPDVILMDIAMPGRNGIEATAIVKNMAPATNVIILSSHSEDEKVFEALKHGATGYLLKVSDNEKVLDAVRTAASGGSLMNAYIARRAMEFFQKSFRGEEKNGPAHDLTRSELRVLSCLCEGMSNKQVADALQVSPETVRTHLRHIYDKLHVRSKTQAVLLAIRHKWV